MREIAKVESLVEGARILKQSKYYVQTPCIECFHSIFIILLYSSFITKKKSHATALYLDTSTTNFDKTLHKLA